MKHPHPTDLAPRAASVRRWSAFALATLSGLAVAGQSRPRYADRANNIVAYADGWRVQPASKEPVIDLTGTKERVSLTSKAQGLNLLAQTVHLETRAIGQGKLDIKRAVATGNVSMTWAKDGRTSAITGSRAVMTYQPAGNVVDMAGPVTIRTVNTEKRQTLVAKGTSGVATLDPAGGSTPTSGLRGATLAGPVRVTLLQAPAPGQKGESRIVATSDRLQVLNSPAGPTVVLIGHVKISGEGANSLGTFAAARATFRLNAKGEVETFQTS